MPEQNHRRRMYLARVEYHAVQEEVEKKLAAGYRARQVYEGLVAAGRLTISYSSFCAYVRGQGQRVRGRKKLPAQKPPNLHRPQPVQSEAAAVNRDRFHHDPHVDMEELVGPIRKPR